MKLKFYPKYPYEYLGKTFSTFKMQTFVCGVCDTFVSLSSLSLLSIILFDVTLFSFQGTTLNMSFLSVFSDFRLSSDGGDEENRTPDPLLARQVLSQLSYTPIGFCGGPKWTRTTDLTLIRRAL